MTGARLISMLWVSLLMACQPSDDPHLPPDVSVLRQQARQGEANAQYRLAMRYRLGQGIAQDDHQALHWMTKAATQGHPAAQYEVGSYYTLPQYPDHDDSKAAYWLRKAAEQGYAPAQFSLGALYYAGRGVAQDCVEAATWFALAATQGDAEALAALEPLAASLSQAEREQVAGRYRQYQQADRAAPRER